VAGIVDEPGLQAPAVLAPGNGRLEDLQRDGDADDDRSPRHLPPELHAGARSTRPEPLAEESIARPASVGAHRGKVDAEEVAMPIDAEVLERLLVTPGRPAGIADRDPVWGGDMSLAAMGKQECKATAKAQLKAYTKELEAAQELLWANDTYALLLIFQALDAAGKDGTIKHVMSGVNPQGCEVRSFKQPSAEELDHDFLWRAGKALPERGRIGIYNRSYYEEVLVVRVHPEWLDRQQLPPQQRGKALWQQRFDSINAFEQHLDHNGTKIVKFFLHVSKDEQRKRFLARLDEPGKEWKFSAADVEERQHWDEYMKAFEEALTATSKPWAPWYVIPADHKFLMRMLVSGIIVSTITALDLSFPIVSAADRAAHHAARKKLESES
jgi:PPK2 family polyphosphate:nucleotide phosphotransferase